jgi:hypothetical protein
MANANPADKQAKLQNAMSRAKKLIQLESNGTLDKIAKGARDGINTSLDGEVMTEQLMTTPRNRRTEAPMIGGQMGENAMNVPAAIRESFSTNPIDESSLYSAFGGAQGGNDDLAFLTEDIPTPRQPQRVNIQTQDVRQLVNEGMGYQQPQYAPQPQMSAQVDYPMIRTIVEEIVRKYAVSLNKKIISEGKSSTSEVNTISLGKTFKFLANDGTIYECQMKKIGNINSKRKSVNG